LPQIARRRHRSFRRYSPDRYREDLSNPEQLALPDAAVAVAHRFMSFNCRPDPRFIDPFARLRLFSPLAGEPVEVAAFAYLDPEWRLLGMRHVRSASPAALDVPIRALVADVLLFDCARVVMAHSHPKGDAVPSAEDRALTKRLARALDALDVELFDHLVLAGNGFASFRALGLL